MNVVLFGATGTVGKHVVAQALEQGHVLTAFCRDRAKLDVAAHPNLRIVEGNVLNPEDVARAMIGQDAVCVVLGSGKSRTSTIRSAGTAQIIRAMQETGVRRLICQTTLGNGDSRENLNFFWKRVMFGWFLKQVYLDHERQEQMVRESDLDWTLVRPGAFTDGDKTGQYKHGFGPHARGLKLKISRADVADFLLKQVQSDAYLHQAPGLSY